MTLLLNLLTLCLLLVSSALASNNWNDFQANDIYPKYDLADCVFPFTYNGVTYTNCTTDGDNGDRPWCSLTSNYIGHFKYCYNFWQSSLTCQSQYTVGPKTFYGCANISTRSPFQQCKTGNSKYQYMYCIDRHLSQSSGPMYHPGTCSSIYTAISPVHTKCFGPSKYAIPSSLADSDKQALLDAHNDFRRDAGASNMLMLYWDDKLADMAQTKANLCSYDHDLSINRRIPEYPWSNGQNLLLNPAQFSLPGSDYYGMYYAEKPSFIYGSPHSAYHYSQAMQANMTRMGCGTTVCLYPDRTEKHTTCHYEISQYTDTSRTPYKQGPACGDCPNSCNNGLCDCQNQICRRDLGEWLDPNSCTCQNASG